MATNPATYICCINYNLNFKSLTLANSCGLLITSICLGACAFLSLTKFGCVIYDSEDYDVDKGFVTCNIFF